MRKTSAFFVTALILVTLIGYVACVQQDQKANPEGQPVIQPIVPDSVFLAGAGSLAMNNPDEFNWTIFARICAKAPQQQPIGANKDTTNDAIWETWPDDPTTYPANPDPQNPPTLNKANLAPAAHKTLEPIQQQQFRRQLLLKNKLFHPQFAPVGGGEESRRNPASFNFIISNNLWYTQGLAAAFKKGTTNGYHPLTFPVNAIEIKAVWKSITRDSMSYYHWNYDSKGGLYGLVALHIMTKALPNWTWATWEWVGNPGRCDILGCSDTYGVNPAVVSPNSTPNQGYPPGQPTPQLLELFKKYGLADEWKNYRLKGSQTDWIDPTGRTTLLGNSITEDGFVQTSSCITCHSNASIDANGAVMPSLGFTPDGQSQNGPVNPGNFWAKSTAPYGALNYFQYDFVWGVFRARPAHNK
jgi:hypothetical protein